MHPFVLNALEGVHPCCPYRKSRPNWILSDSGCRDMISINDRNRQSAVLDSRAPVQVTVPV